MSSFPTCKLCHQKFSLKGPAPFLLPCLHCVCETCVTSAAGGVISCSTCQRDVNLTETRLQKDVITEKEILHFTVKQHPELVLCTHEEDGNQAVCWCKECEDFLCENCQMIHDRFKITKQHVVEDIADLQPGSFDVDTYCKIHPKFILDTWDEQCCILICIKCKHGDHADHKTVDFDEAVDTARKEVADFGRGVCSSSTQQADILSAIDTDLQALDETCSTLTENISHTFNPLKSLMDQREKELQIELQQHQEEVRRELNEKKNTSESCQKKCRTTSDYISKTLQYSSRHDIMSLRPILQSKTGECISSAQAIVHESPPLPRLDIDGLEKMKSVLVGFGAITMKNDLGVAKQTIDCGSQTEDRVSTECENLKLELLQLRTSHEKDMTSMRETLSIIKEERKKGLYILTTDVPELAYLLNCACVKFSRTQYNARYVHINTEGELTNRVLANTLLPDSADRLEKYKGTSSTVPLQLSRSTQYFEVKVKLKIEEPLKRNNLLLEIGLTRKEEQNQSHRIARRPHSYSITVEHCSRHSSMCRKIRRHVEPLCLPDTLKNITGTSATLHFGVVYDSVRGRIAFLDVKNDEFIGKIDNVDSSVALWPMFGVYNPSQIIVRMSLVVGSDIEITDSKKALVLECFT